MVAPAAGLFVFHWSRAVYCVDAATGIIAWTKAAFGEKVPAKPPDSFHATICPAPYEPPVTKIPRSWLYPAAPVKRSAFALSSAAPLADGVNVIRAGPASRSDQLTPSLPVSVDCLTL